MSLFKLWVEQDQQELSDEKIIQSISLEIRALESSDPEFRLSHEPINGMSA